LRGCLRAEGRAGSEGEDGKGEKAFTETEHLDLDCGSLASVNHAARPRGALARRCRESSFRQGDDAAG